MLTISPGRPAAINRRPNCWLRKNVPRRLLAMTASQSAQVTSTASLRRLLPALLNEQVDPSECRGDIRHCALDAGLRTEIEHQDDRLHAERFELCDGAIEVFGAGCRHRDIEAVAGERQGGRGADSV